MNSKADALSFVQRCKNVLSANWKGHLNTVKGGSKEEIHTSKVLYTFRKGKSYLWLHVDDLHNINTMFDERGSLAVMSAVPGPLVGLLRSLRKLPARVALAGDLIRLKDEQVPIITEDLRESVLLEENAVSQASYTVSALLNSCSISCKSKSEQIHEILNQEHVVYKFNINSCTYVGGGSNHAVEWAGVKVPRSDLLLPFSEKVIDGINQSESRRRALMVLCLEYKEADVRDALMLSIDHSGFDVLAKVAEKASLNSNDTPYVWKEFRFDFKEDASDIEGFCRLLIGLEEEAIQRINEYSGLGLKTG